MSYIEYIIFLPIKE